MKRLHLPAFIEIRDADELHPRPGQCLPQGRKTLLGEMGRALNQEAEAYETREGLTILSL